MKRNIAYILLGLLVYGAFLVMSFPAERAFVLLQSQLPMVRVAGVEGTAWSGRAAVIQIQNQSLQRVKWQFNPWGLFLARVEFDLSFDGDGRKGSAMAGLRSDGTLALSNVDMQIPMVDVSQILNLGPVLGPIELGGLLEMQLSELTVLSTIIQSAEGSVYWRRAGVTEPLTQALGEFVAQLTTEEDGVHAQVKDESGPLQLDGNFKLDSGGGYTFRASVAVRDQQQKMLVQGLQALGQRGADGRVVVEYSGQL
jgi:hypothetical protein